jgi:hypothetical protein
MSRGGVKDKNIPETVILKEPKSAKLKKKGKASEPFINWEIVRDVKKTPKND